MPVQILQPPDGGGILALDQGLFGVSSEAGDPSPAILLRTLPGRTSSGLRPPAPQGGAGSRGEEGRLDVLNVYSGGSRAVRVRHKSIDVYQKIEIRYGLEDDKMQRYGELLRSMLHDQVQLISDRNHLRKITHANGRNSLAMAVEAMRLADDSP